MKEISKRVSCKNGVNLSIQASSSHYSTPRTDEGPYICVEVGFPDVAPPKSWKEYIDGDWVKDDRRASVYGYVPVSLVFEYIEDNGGLLEELPEGHVYHDMEKKQ